MALPFESSIRKLHRFLRDIRRHFTFTRTYGAFRGVFRDFDEAIAHAPAGADIGYDHDRLAADYARALSAEPRQYDYPILFWLSRLIRTGLRVFDLGGNVGIHFYTCRRYIDLPDELIWEVCEVPAIAKAGKIIADRRGAAGLFFTTDITKLGGADVLLASGVLHHFEKPQFEEILASVSDRPQNLLLNRLPIYDGVAYVTLQNGGGVFYPQRIMNRTDFINVLKQLGYEIVDHWEDLVDSCIIPFHPDKSLLSYHGLYARRAPARPASCGALST